MAAVRDTEAMISGMAPVLDDVLCHFCVIEDEALTAQALAMFREDVGLSLILSEDVAASHGLITDLPMRRITLTVHSALDGVGLTAAVAQALAEATRSAGAFRAQRVVGLAHVVLADLAERSQAGDDAPLPGRMQVLNALIAAHMAEGWSARDYATRLNVTTGHLSRLTRAATGQGAAAYIEGRVMAEASRLLAFTQLSVAEIGYRLGYADPSYFTKRFRKAQGEAPSDYRARFVG